MLYSYQCPFIIDCTLPDLKLKFFLTKKLFRRKHLIVLTSVDICLCRNVILSNKSLATMSSEHFLNSKFQLTCQLHLYQAYLFLGFLNNNVVKF